MSALVHPLQALLLAPDNAAWLATVEGRKPVTIRQGHRDYRPGLVMICCDIANRAVKATITKVRHVTVRQVTADECRLDGFTGRADMLAGLRRFYPDMTLDSPVTVIHYQDVQGSLAANPSSLLARDRS